MNTLTPFQFNPQDNTGLLHQLAAENARATQMMETPVCDDANEGCKLNPADSQNIKRLVAGFLPACQ